MVHFWKVPHLAKGTMTFVPFFNRWRQSWGTTGGSNSSRYCYSVWLRHLVKLSAYGFEINGAEVGELGPGDSLGTGLAALLLGAKKYSAFDIVPFSSNSHLSGIFEELVGYYSQRQPIPDDTEFPRLRPRLRSYEFPAQFVEWSAFNARVQRMRQQLREEENGPQTLGYQTSSKAFSALDGASLDLVFSQAVLEHVDALEDTYEAMFACLKPGGFASHSIDFSAHHLSPFWNGHWAYSDWEWRLVRGKREFLLNREPLSTHLRCAKDVGFRILSVEGEHGVGGLESGMLFEGSRLQGPEDAATRGASLILRK